MSNIKPGQKLQDGDYFLNGTKDQYLELLEIERPKHRDNGYDSLLCKCDIYNGLFFNGKENLFRSRKSILGTEYNFDDFKQLCENTFNKE